MTKDEALKLALEALNTPRPTDSYPPLWRSYEKTINDAITAIKQALAAPVQPVAFLANGTRFKISYDSRQSGGQIHGIPPELGGRWVAFVAADDDCHLKLTTPPAAQRKWVGLTDDEILKMAYPIRWQEVDDFEADKAVNFAQAIEAKLRSKSNG